MDFQFHSFEPPRPLRPLLRSSFFARGRIGYRTDKILPTGLVAVLFTLGHAHRCGKSADPGDNACFDHAWVEGVQTTPSYHTPLDGTHVLGLLFEPLGFHAIFGADMPGLRDRALAARAVLPADFIDFIEARLPRAAGAPAHTEICAALLARERLALPAWLASFYAAIVARRGEIDIDDWYARSGYSARHAARQFSTAVGVTDKVLCRIHRLLALLEAIDPAQAVNWTALAHAFGFYDQAHFNHEFRKLSGLFPGEYLARRRRDLPDLGRGESVVFAPQR